MIVTQARLGSGLNPLATQALQARLLGEIILPGDAEYDAARRVHNALIDRYPNLIVRAADAGDVVRAVEFARVRDLPLAVRGGGHSLPGYGAIDGGVVVELSRMRSVSVFPERRTAWVQAGATSRDLIEAAEPHGLALSTGDTSSVGLGGLTLGGGIGWLVRKHGLTIDNLLAVEMVIADGRIVVASEDQHPDLFWALRGGGGNFGIATGFEFQLHPDARILGGVLVLPATAGVLRGYADYVPEAPDELTTISLLMLAPPLPFLPAEVHGKLVFITFVSYAGDPEAGQRAVEPLRALAEPFAEMVGPMPYSGMFDFTSMATSPHPERVRSGFMPALGDEAIAALLDHFEKRPLPTAAVQLRGLGGAMSRVSKEATAFAHRDKPFYLSVASMGADATDEVWMLDLWRELRPFASGVYVNFLEDEGEARIHEAYPPATYARLAEVKRRYDPTNLFRLNQNIKPAS